MNDSTAQARHQGWIRRNWKIIVPVTALAAAFGAWLFFGFFGFHTAFIDDTVEEAAPVFQSGATVAAAETAPTTEATSAPAATNDDPAPQEDPPVAETAAPDDAAPEPVATVPVPEVVTLASGEFIDRSHPASGTALILTDGSEIVLRLDEFATDNGPDLNVYLSTAEPGADASEFDDDFVDLGDLKGNIGSQNYTVPGGVDVGRYRSVVIWCVRFGVAFGAAPLDAPSGA